MKPVAWQARIRPDWRSPSEWTEWKTCTEAQAKDYLKSPLLNEWHYEVRALYAHPEPVTGIPATQPVELVKQLVEAASEWIGEEDTGWDAIEAGRAWLGENE